MTQAASQDAIVLLTSFVALMPFVLGLRLAAVSAINETIDLDLFVDRVGFKRRFSLKNTVLPIY